MGVKYDYTSKSVVMF